MDLNVPCSKKKRNKNLSITVIIAMSILQDKSAKNTLSKQFNLSFNSAFNEQFNKEYVQQQKLLESNPKFLRTRQSLEAERRNNIGSIMDLAPYPLYQEDTLRPTTIRKQAFTHVVSCNLLNQLYLSPENIENVQQRIRYAVWLASNKQNIISKQSEKELVIIMRSIYLTYGKNIPGPHEIIKQQITELNDLVIQECVSKILSEIQAHNWYLWHRSTQPMPLARAQNLSTKGTKQLPSVTSLFFT